MISLTIRRVSSAEMLTTLRLMISRTLTGLIYHAGAAAGKPTTTARIPRMSSRSPESPAESVSGPLESLFQEFVRRGAALGFSSFFLTEEAIRRAFADKVPAEWLEYINRQGEDVRNELVDRLAREFGEWLRGLDVGELVETVLARNDFSVHVELRRNPPKP